MFSGLAAIEGHHRKRWTALVSFTLQGILVSAAVILPLLNPAGLPNTQHKLPLPISLGGPPIRARQDVTRQPGGPISLAPIVVRPISVTFGRRSKALSTDPIAPEAATGGSGQGSTSIICLFSGSYEPPVPRPVEKPRPVSVVMEGNLIRRVEPQYPNIAKQIRLQGVVLLKALVGADGRIERIQVMSGHPILVQAARDAVNQWRYRPYFLNGMPIPVETEITVKFVLNQ